MLSVTTDYATGTGPPEPYLRRIAQAGFTHIHWCHQWNTDFIYTQPEVGHIAAVMDEVGLQLLDLHGTVGPEKNWGSGLEYERLAGVDILRNRMEMTARLGGEVVIMHLPGGDANEWWPRIAASLDEAWALASERGLRIAVENGGTHASFDDIERVLDAYPSEYVGLCYDSGHGNLFTEGLDRLERISNRLISVHLHDNDGTADQHKLLFSGTTDWPRLAGILAASAYDECVSMEVATRGHDFDSETTFLRQALETGTRFAEMIAGS